MTADRIAATVIEAVPDPLAKVGPAEIAKLFGRAPSWFDRTGQRARLYAAGFPRPITRGQWLKRDVVAFILRASNTDGRPPAPAGQPSPAPVDAFTEVIGRTREHMAQRRKTRGENHAR